MVMVMDQELGADNSGEQIKEGQKTGDGLTGQMWCTEYSQLWRGWGTIRKILPQGFQGYTYHGM